MAATHTGDGGRTGRPPLDNARTAQPPSTVAGLGGTKAPRPSTKAGRSAGLGGRGMITVHCGGTDPRVPSDNNAAERSLRPLVVSRKISGGTRSHAGSDTKMTLAS